MYNEQFIPKSDHTEIRDKSVSLRVTYKEFIDIKRAAKLKDMSVTQWARKVLKEACHKSTPDS
jgi:uncharacterized protein (DUF1778 family)